jgi:hypothetical protein
MNLSSETLAAIKAQARKDHQPDPARWLAVLATVRVMRRDRDVKTVDKPTD